MEKSHSSWTESSGASQGNRISQLDVTPTKATRWVYGYDWLDRLESVKKAEAATVGALGALQLVAMYTYDAADNRYLFEVPNLSNPALTETFRYSYDDADSITKIEKKVGAGAYSSMETFTSDDDGNLLTRTDVATGVVTTYSWTDFNRLKAISTSDDSKKQSHTFGISGFRRKKKDKGDVETTEYAAGLSTEVSKVTSGETITYLMGSGIMGLERASDGAMFYFLTDALGTVRDVVDSTGAVKASYEFSEYGQRIASSETGVSTQKTFVGGASVQDEVADTGLMMMGHRFYAPDLGRFLNRDPIGFKGGPNLFEYSSSSPVGMTDATGLKGKLTFHANSDHAWVEYQPIEMDFRTYDSMPDWGPMEPSAPGLVNLMVKNETRWSVTLGTFRTSLLSVNREGHDGYVAQASLSMLMDDEAEKNFLAYAKNKNNARWTPKNNCAAWARGAWKAAGGESVEYENFLGNPSPWIIRESIGENGEGARAWYSPMRPFEYIMDRFFWTPMTEIMAPFAIDRPFRPENLKEDVLFHEALFWQEY